MDRNFNAEVAADVYDLIVGMDDAAADTMIRCVTFDLLSKALADNARLVHGATTEIAKEIRDEVAKSLMVRGDDPRVIQAAELVGEIAKGDYWKQQRRDEDGRWTISISRTKRSATEPVNPPRDFNVTGALDATGRETNRFADKWHERGANDDSTNAQTYRRIGAGARVVGMFGGPKTKAAAQLGQLVGEHGPEAEKVVGPSLRRAAYRYRGTEKTPDRDLIAGQRKQAEALMRNDGLRPEQFGTPERFEASQKAAIEYLSGRLPNSRLSGLQQASGKIPPSEGVMLNADGKIITQAVGYSDDHYLPFNLKNLKGLQGGAYVRSRSSGGLTAEDIYTGLVGGARSVTVVSRSGVFTLDFEDDFRGSRRYNDKAAQMVDRYAKTLDAVKSEQVSRKGVSPDEKAAIREEVENDIGDFSSRQEIEDEIQARIKDFRTSTVPTKAELEAIDVESKKDNPDPAKQRLVRSNKIDALMDEKAKRQYRLDGEGYAVAMDALKEQFPYYIANARYIHRGNATFDNHFSAEADAGYVKPRYNRPEGAKEGYFDPSINGRGKVSADRTNYQNWTNNPENRRARAEQPQGGATATAERPVNPKQQVAAAQARASAHVNEDRALLALIHTYANHAGGGGYPTLAATKGATDEQIAAMISDPGVRDKMKRDLVGIHREAATALPEVHDAASAQFRVYEAAEGASGGTEYSKEALGRSPARPFTFRPRGGSADPYVPGAPAEAYTAEAKRQAHRAGIPEAADWDDDQLRREANYAGTIAVHARRKMADASYDNEPMLEALARHAPPGPEGNKRLVQVMSQLGSTKGSDLEKVVTAAEGKAEALERIRAVKAMTPSTPEPRELVHDSAAPVRTGQTKDQLADQFKRNAETLESHGQDEHAQTHWAMASALEAGNRADVQAAFDSMTPADRRVWRQHFQDNGIDV